MAGGRCCFSFYFAGQVRRASQYRSVLGSYRRMGVLIFDSRPCQLRKEKMLTATSMEFTAVGEHSRSYSHRTAPSMQKWKKINKNYAKGLLCFFVYYCAKSELSAKGICHTPVKRFFTDPHSDPHGEKHGRKQWKRKCQRRCAEVAETVKKAGLGSVRGLLHTS